jgi:hypothetical protein
MLRKYASLQVLDAWKVPAGDSRRALRKAAHRVQFDYQPRPGYLYARARMISSRCNDNWDSFSAEELEKSYKTFLGKPVFVNHHNASHRRARGVIVAVALHRDRNPDGTPDTWVEGLHEIDAVRFPKLARAILTGRVNRTSMGVDVDYSICSACNNKATSPAEYCTHMPAKKGRKIRQRSAEGKLVESTIHEKCYGLHFFENSFLVEDPADPSAVVLGNIDDRGLYMSPRAASTDRGDNAIAHSVLAGNIHQGELIAPRVTAPNRNLGQQFVLDDLDVSLGQLGGRVAAAGQAPAFGHHVGRVNRIRAQEPVHRVHAEDEVARMTYYESRRDRPAQQAEPPAVSPDGRPLRIGKGKTRVSLGESAARPGVARSRAAAEVNMGEVSFDFSRSPDKLPRRSRPANHERYLTGNVDDRGLHMAASKKAVSAYWPEGAQCPSCGGKGLKKPRFLDPAQVKEFADAEPGHVAECISCKKQFDASRSAQAQPSPQGRRPGQTRSFPDPEMPSGARLSLLRRGRREAAWTGESHLGPGAVTRHLKQEHGLDEEQLRHHLSRATQRAHHWDIGDIPNFFVGVHSDMHGGDLLHGQVNEGAVPHRHLHDDPLHLPKPDSPAIHPIRDFERDIEYKERPGMGHLHPGRTDEHPNRQAWDEEEDPGKWSNLGACPHVYSQEEQDSAFHNSQGEPHPDRDKGETYLDVHDAYAKWRSHAEEKGVFCPGCGAYKWMHATLHPSESGQLKPEFREKRIEEFRNFDTAPYHPLKQSQNALHSQGGGRIWTPDDAMLHSLSRRKEALLYARPEDHPFFQANPVSSQNIVDAYHDSMDQERQDGNNWYSDAHHVAKAIAGGDAARGAGLLAAYSPRVSWPLNLHYASRAHRENRALGPGDGTIMGSHQRAAQQILDGHHHSEVFKGSKILAFAHLIEHGGDSLDDIADGAHRVVVDRHALSAAMGRRASDNDLQSAPLGKPRYYEHVADQYRQAAADLSAILGQDIAPHQVQATVWLRQQRRNRMEDSAVRNQLGKGRLTRERNAWTQWGESVKQHHPDLPGENMHVHASRKTAYGETAVPPQIDTLRTEACPVCGESNVYKAQRCPVCGYVAPPDIFRDPDVTKAQQLRDEAEEVPSGLPQGPADEQEMAQGSFPDADAQLYHPDQIAPNGTPGTMNAQGPDGLPQDPAEQALQGEEEEQQGEQEMEQGEEEQDEAQQAEVMLACPACGAQFSPGEAQEGQPCPACGQAPLQAAGPEGPEGDEDAEPGGEDEAQPEGEAEPEPDDGSEDEDDEDDEEKDGPPWARKGQMATGKARGLMGKENATTAALRAQQGVIEQLRAQNAVLSSQLGFIASLAGIPQQEMDRVRHEAMRRQGDMYNPAQPVPDPPAAPAPETTEQALQPDAQADASRPGTEPGSTTHVPAAQTTTAIQPGVTLQTPAANMLVDVTAPIQGTGGDNNPMPGTEQRRIETDVRIDPDPLKARGPGIGGQGNDGTSFPWVISARQDGGTPQEEDTRARVLASLRLARLRITSGLARGDELDVAGEIERDASLSGRDISREIDVLSRTAQLRPAPRPQRRTAARSAPSLASAPAPAMTYSAPAASLGDWVDDGVDLFLG